MTAKNHKQPDPAPPLMEEAPGLLQKDPAPRPTLEPVSWGVAKELALLRHKQFTEDGLPIPERLAILEREQAIIAPYLVDVPRAWLVKHAPEHIDWSLPESQNWLRKDRWNTLVDHVIGWQAEEDAKNS